MKRSLGRVTQYRTCRNNFDAGCRRRRRLLRSGQPAACLACEWRQLGSFPWTILFRDGGTRRKQRRGSLPGATALDLCLWDCLQRFTLPLPYPNIVHHLVATVPPTSRSGERHPLPFLAALFSLTPNAGEHCSRPLASFARTQPAAAVYGNFSLHLASPRALRGRAKVGSDAAADLPSAGGVGPGPPRFRRRGRRVRDHPVLFATQDEEESNPLPARNVATDSLDSVDDHRRRPQIHKEKLRFGVLRPRSPLLKVLSSSTSVNQYFFLDSFTTARVFCFDSPSCGRDPPFLRYTILYPVKRKLNSGKIQITTGFFQHSYFILASPYEFSRSTLVVSPTFFILRFSPLVQQTLSVPLKL
jgi:hypothetical protein